MKKQANVNKRFKQRKRRVRAKIKGTGEKPRLAVARSLTSISCQVINDELGQTLVSASDKSIEATGNKVEKAKAVGLAIAKAASEKGINKVVFDRSAYKYHGRVKALADGAREGGLEF